jgi:tRNA (Thr-GGU) A37 N-methylase
VDGLSLTVRGLDAVDGTPILDIKASAEGFGPRGVEREPRWVRELMGPTSGPDDPGGGGGRP